MSTVITFSDGTQAHIMGMCRQGTTVFRYIERGRVYKKESVAIRRAFALYRKQRYGSIRLRRHRRLVKEKKTMYIETIIKPQIVTYLEDGHLWHYVIDTGERFKKERMAILNAIRYARRNNSKPGNPEGGWESLVDGEQQ